MITGTKTQRRERRHRRVRAKISGTPERPRLAVCKSNTGLSAQVIDDTTGTTLLSAYTNASKKKTLQERIAETGEKLATEAKKKGIDAVVFDRGGFKYVGNIKTFADSLRAGGLKF